MNKKINIGVAGLGFIGPAHIEALRRLPEVHVLAVNHSSKESTEAKAKALGIERAYATFEEMAQDTELDCIHICTPNHLHYEMAKTALLAGKHVICEKPLANTVAEAEELLALAQEKNLRHAVHFNIRYYPLVRQMRKLREEGSLGRVYNIMGSYLQDWLFRDTDYNWRLEPDKSGDSRAIADIGSHLMDLLEYISGLRISEVMADFQTVHSHRKKPKKAIETYSGKLLAAEDYEEVPIHTEDYASVLLRFSDGQRGVITVCQTVAGRKNQLKLEISGSHATLAWNSEQPNELWIGQREEANQVLLRDPALVHEETRRLISFPGGHNEGFPDTSKQFFKEFYQALREESSATPPYPTFEDGLRELHLIERIVESHQKQTWLKV